MRVIIEPNSLEVYAQSIYPAMKLKINLDFDEDVIPLSIKGQVYSEDMNLISKLAEIPTARFFGIDEFSLPEQSSQEKNTMLLRSLNDGRELTKTNRTKELVFTLDNRTLDYIEEQHEKNDSKDLLLLFYFKVEFLKHYLRLGEYQTVEHNRNSYLISSNYLHALRSNNFNLLTSFHQLGNHHIFFQSDYSTDRVSYKITASDWITKFKDKLDMGKFIIVEIPTSSVNLSIPSDAELDDTEKLLKERIESAYKAIVDMESEIKKGEWLHVVEKISALKLFKNGLTKYIKNIIDRTTGIGEEKAQDLTMAIDKLHDYSSAFHHPENVEASSYQVNKEDAFLAYMLTCSITNLLAKNFSSVLNKKYSTVH